MASLSGPIDLQGLSERCFGDGDLMAELLDLFAAQCERLAPQLAGESTASGARAAAHTLVGSAAAVGAEQVAALARRVEAAWARGEGPDDHLLAETVEAVEAARAAALQGRG